MMAELLTGGLLTLTCYSGLPTLCLRLGLAGGVRAGDASQRQVAITFDDGPDPYYTPQVLAVLLKHGVRACFFMLGHKAEAYPELVRQVAAAGHDVGIHGFRHRLQTFVGPRSTRRELEHTARILTDIIGVPPRFLRPPWGVFNLFTALAARRQGFIPVGWSVHPWDWAGGRAAGALYRCVMRQVHPGGVLLLHDASGPLASQGAPERLVHDLPRVLRGLRHAGYEIVPLDQVLRKQPGSPIPNLPTTGD